MTPVQASTVPLFMKNKDVVVEAATGSGKTLAFIIPILEILIRSYRDGRGLKKNQVGAIIITPTRELAGQIYEVAKTFLGSVKEFRDREIIARESDTGIPEENDDEDEEKRITLPNLSHGCYIGGTPLQEDIGLFLSSPAQLLIATPGRLLAMLSRPHLLNVKDLDVLVLDEADRLLDMGFEQALNQIFAKLPKQRRTGLFSATMSEGLAQIVRVGLRNPVNVQVKVEATTPAKAPAVTEDAEEVPKKAKTQHVEQMTPSSLSIGYTMCEPDRKVAELVHFLERGEGQGHKVMVYFATCACVDYYFKILSQLPHLKSHPLHSLHGKQPPLKRTATFQSFTSAPPPAVLLCTDVAARGLDIPDIDWVVQFDPPQDPKAFAHRCGRTGRAGRGGRAVVYLGEGEESYVDFLRVRKVPVTEFPSALKNVETEIPAPAPLPQPLVLPRKVPTKANWHPTAILNQILLLNLSDRALHDLSLRAFVSFIRAYNEHQASFIFQFKKLDVGGVARGFGLARLPKMPELKNRKTTFEPIVLEGDIKFKDKAREKHRLDALEKKRAEGDSKKSKKKETRGETVAWSDHKDRKAKRLERREKREKKRIAVVKAKSDGSFVAKPAGTKPTVEASGKRTRGGHDSSSDDDSSDGGGADDWEDMKKEQRQTKKAKSQGMSFF
ncbi:DEAD-domain-containing protein [Phlyctochytrium arcticum]|nr:DEAD-domain-containing protein [Phlyctochytrium arcticum]